jgi:DNA polymerase-3 subunit delta'
MRFSEIPGLDKIKEDLAHVITQGTVAHAQVFMGKEGSGNLALALAYATMLNCENPTPTDSCGKCAACIKNDKFIHPDLHFVFPVSLLKGIQSKDAVSDRFITEWRTFLKDNPYGGPMEWGEVFGGENKALNISKEESRNIIKALSLKSFEGKYKIMLVWLAEYMHSKAANALLKILEEPPPNTLFLLVTNDYEQLLTTIISRTQLVNIRDFRDAEIQEYLQNKLQLPQGRAAAIAHMADGSLNEALHLANEVEDDTHAMFRDWLRQCYQRKYTELTLSAEQFGGLNKMHQKSLFRYGLDILREALVYPLLEPHMLRLSGEELDFVKNFAKVVNIDVVNAATKELNSALYHLERNANPKILFLDISIAMAGILHKAR